MSEAQSELLLAVRRVVGAFDELGIDYLIGGSLASSVHGEPRQTVDADLLAAVLGRHAQALGDLLGNEFYVNVEAIKSAVVNQSSFNLIHLATMTKVDVFISWRTPFGQEQMKRRQSIVVDQLPPLLFASPEDTIVSKLEWFRKGGSVSDRQWRDILGVIKVQGENLDTDYLTKWARELQLEDLLKKALLEAGPGR